MHAPACKYRARGRGMSEILSAFYLGPQISQTRELKEHPNAERQRAARGTKPARARWRAWKLRGPYSHPSFLLFQITMVIAIKRSIFLWLLELSHTQDVATGHELATALAALWGQSRGARWAREGYTLLKKRNRVTSTCLTHFN